VLISSGSKSIEAACVDKFVEAGARIAFTYRNDEETASQIISMYSSQILQKGRIVNELYG